MRVSDPYVNMSEALRDADDLIIRKATELEQNVSASEYAALKVQLAIAHSIRYVADRLDAMIGYWEDHPYAR